MHPRTQCLARPTRLDVSRGITLLELCFALALLAVLAGLAAPGFRTSLRTAAVRSASFDLLAGLHEIRAVAILQGRVGVFCPAGVGLSGDCLPASASAPAWQSFLEEGSARAALAAQDLPRGVEVRATRSPLRFWPHAHAASTGTLTICDVQAVAAPRAIVISQSGRARLAAAAADACAG
jgi:type IV fimbrial biogenesis protein FimT